MKELIIIASLFVLIIVLLRLKTPLWMVMLSATVALGIVSHFSPRTFLKVLVNTCIEPSTGILLLFLYMVSILEKILRESGSLDRMIAAMERYVPGRRLRLIMMPAFLGFLASPGGAMFSAPFVQKAGEGMGLSQEHKTFINYWFRHLWEYSLPLYPSTVMASTILSIPVGLFFRKMFPCTLFVIAGGVIFCLAMLKLGSREKEAPPPVGRLSDLLLGIFPVAVLIILVAFFHVNIAVALAFVLIFESARARLSLKAIRGLLRESFSLQLMLAVLAILLFKEALETGNLAAGLSVFLGQRGVPLPLLFFLIPFAVGFLTGITQAAVGITFPLLLVMRAPAEGLNLFCMSYAAAMMGVMLSPTHLCLILTAQYFNVDFTRIYRYMVLPLLFVGAASMMLYLAF